jgi:hypothetical protein
MKNLFRKIVQGIQAIIDDELKIMDDYCGVFV